MFEYNIAKPGEPQHSAVLPSHCVHKSRLAMRALLLVGKSASVPQLHVSPKDRQRRLFKDIMTQSIQIRASRKNIQRNPPPAFLQAFGNKRNGEEQGSNRKDSTHHRRLQRNCFLGRRLHSTPMTCWDCSLLRHSKELRPHAPKEQCLHPRMFLGE